MASLLPTAAQDEIRNLVARYLADNLPVDRLRNPETSNGKAEQALWRDMASLGFFGLGLPANVDGAACSAAEEALAFREIGRFLISPAVLATTLAAHLALNAGHTELARKFVNGASRASLGLSGRGQRTESDLPLLLCDHSAGDYVLCWFTGGIGLLSPEAVPQLERATPLDDAISFHRAKIAGRVPSDICSVASGDALELRANLLVAAMLAGVAEAARDMAVDYAKMREQFGRPIGSFQAIKHKCADMAIRAEMAWAQTVFAAISNQDNQSDLAFQVAAAKIVAARGAMANASDNIQIHGAIGFTLDCHAHRFLKRAHLLGQCGGSAREKKSFLLAQPATL